MKDDFTGNFFKWADKNSIHKDYIASFLDKGIQTISNWKSSGIPKSQQLACQALMDRHESEKMQEEIKNVIVLKPSYEQFQAWNKASLEENKTIEQWAFDSLEKVAEEWEKSQRSKITAHPSSRKPRTANKRPHIMAAAGSPIEAELLEELETDGIIRVKVNGLSMEPLFHDGDTIAFKHKKGLVFANFVSLLATLILVPIPLLMPMLVDEVLLNKSGAALTGQTA